MKLESGLSVKLDKLKSLEIDETNVEKEILDRKYWQTVFEFGGACRHLANTRDREQRYDNRANRDITFTKLSGDYESEAAIVSYTK